MSSLLDQSENKCEKKIPSQSNNWKQLLSSFTFHRVYVPKLEGSPFSITNKSRPSGIKRRLLEWSSKYYIEKTNEKKKQMRASRKRLE